MPGLVTQDALLQGAMARLLLQQEVQELFLREADMLDTRAYDDWLDLLSDDIRYWMPLRRNLPLAQMGQDGTDPDDIAWFNDDKPTLTKRVRQLQTGVHWIEEPVSRYAHVISGILLAEGVNQLGDDEEVDVSSRFIVYQNRLDDEVNLFVGRRYDRLRRQDGRLLVASRKILLEQSVLLGKALTTFF